MAARDDSKRAIARRIQRLLPFAAPNLRLLSERELRMLERYLVDVTDQEPDCGWVGGGQDG